MSALPEICRLSTHPVGIYEATSKDHDMRPLKENIEDIQANRKEVLEALIPHKTLYNHH